MQLTENQDMDINIAEWQDGRVGIMHGTRFDTRDFGCVLHTSDGTRFSLALSDPPYYAVMLQKVMAFFRTGISPIPLSETLEIIAFLQAADASRAENGKKITIGQ